MGELSLDNLKVNTDHDCLRVNLDLLNLRVNTQAIGDDPCPVNQEEVKKPLDRDGALSASIRLGEEADYFGIERS